MLLDEARAHVGGAVRRAAHEVVGGVLVEARLVLLGDERAVRVAFELVEASGAHEVLGEAVRVLRGALEGRPGWHGALDVVERALVGAIGQQLVERLAVERMAGHRFLERRQLLVERASLRLRRRFVRGPVGDGRTDQLVSLFLHNGHAPPPRCILLRAALR